MTVAIDKYVFCVLGASGELIDVSLSEKGAKNYATRHGYRSVYRRNWMTGYFVQVAFKPCNRWRTSHA